ncbi:MAG: lipid-A-disaccharide synthase [Bacteroidetes bacterium]|nr:lipid-A-disaccharide synthase [Bacteroidota bacterium]
MKYYIIAGEASGDVHAANLIRSIKDKDEESVFRAWGGDRMEAQGAEIVKHYRDLAFMGFVEVLLNIRTISNNISFCKKDILLFRPDILVLVDYPGFNLRIAEFAHKQGIKVVYYVSPQVWAWKKSRVHKIKRVVDKMLVILPFEKAFYEKYGVDVDFVGHPLLDEIKNQKKISKSEFHEKNKLNSKPIIALLPGSRKQEINSMLKSMLTVINHFPDHQFIVAGLSSINIRFYHDILRNSPAKLVVDQTDSLLQHAVAALVTSGTATLETALMEVPEVVCYKGNFISVAIARHIIDVKYISLVNLIMEREIVKELIQGQLNTKNLLHELELIVRNKKKLHQLQLDYKELKERLGKEGASEHAAALILELILD